MIPIVYDLRRGGLYVVVDDDGNYVGNVHVIKIPKKEETRFKFNEKMELVDLAKRKYDKKTLKRFEIKENGLNERSLVVESIELDGSDRQPLIHISVFEKGVFKSEFKMSHKQAQEVRGAILETLFKEDRKWEKQTVFFSTETVIYISLLKSLDYRICCGDLQDLGILKETGRNALETLEKRGNLKLDGYTSQKKYYTATISKDDLVKIFSAENIEPLESE